MKRLLIFIVPISLVLGSCSKNLTSLDVDTKHASSVPPTTLFTMGEKNLVDDYTSTSVGSAPFRVLSQEWTENSYVYEAQYNFSAYNANSGWWNNLYRIALSNINAAKAGFPSYIKDPIALKNSLCIADVLEVYIFNMLVTTYGPIPYKEALNPLIPYPKYDDEKTIFTDLLTRLDTCINAFNTASGSIGNADQIYLGNVAKWKKFAATLKLKMAMVISDVDATTASKKVQEAIASGVFTSNSDNATFAYQSDAVGNSNMLWQALINSGRNDFAPANYLVNTMNNWNDPRRPLYFTKDINGVYSGAVPGNANNYGDHSDFSAQMVQPKFPGVILDYTETEFLLAEAAERGFAGAGTAALHYNNAITSSIQYWGGSTADAATYLLQPAVAYATATGTWQQKIGYQKWIANYNKNWDSWTDIRRLGFPHLDVVNPPVKAQGNLPLRFTYPANESGSNKTNFDAAVKLLPGGQDVVSAKLFWMK